MSSVEHPQKQKILRSAAKLFAQNGYDATGVAAIGEAVGLGRGALYYHIQSKEDLLYEISVAHVIAMVQFGEALLEEDAPADEKLRTLARRLMATIAENLPELTVYFADSRALTGGHRREVTQIRERFEAVWRRLLEEGGEQGTFRDLDPLVVKGILGMFNYSFVWLRPRGSRRPEEVADLFVDLILDGLMPRDGE
jgi:AcrR family transcriptional regulator